MPISTQLMAIVLASASSIAAGTIPDRSMIVKAFDEVAFKPIIPSRPDGPQMGVLRGDPDVGPSDMLLKMHMGTGVLHTHTSDYHLTVISGEMKHWDASSEESRVHPLGPGSYGFQPGGEPPCRFLPFERVRDVHSLVREARRQIVQTRIGFARF